MITGECHYCHSVRVWKLHPIRHEESCPTAGRRPQRLSPAESAVFTHPDLVEVDLYVSAWYPALVA